MELLDGQMKKSQEFLDKIQGAQLTIKESKNVPWKFVRNELKSVRTFLWKNQY